MNIQQIRILVEAARRGFNLTEVAAALYTAQSGVSRHIKDLEDELGVELFVRKGKRLLGLTEPGREAHAIASRVMLELAHLRDLAARHARGDRGDLVIATTHTQARYALPAIIARFREARPQVHLTLHQDKPQGIAAMLLDGEADIGIATEALHTHEELVTFPFYEWHHAIIVPAGHPLAARGEVPLVEVAEHPIVTYHTEFTGRAQLDDAFAARGLIADIVLDALDADVIKTYVRLGLGIGIIADVAWDEQRDQGLALLSCPELERPALTRVALRRGRPLRDYVFSFVALCTPGLDAASVVRALGPPHEPAD